MKTIKTIMLLEIKYKWTEIKYLKNIILASCHGNISHLKQVYLHVLK